jgi:hypothetical protein
MIRNAARIVLVTLAFAVAMTVIDRGGSAPPEPAARPVVDDHLLTKSSEPAGPVY